MKLCVCYEYHDDSKLNPVMETLQLIRPEILIENTPGGLWGSPTNAKVYPDSKVFSYITGGYEGTKYHNAQDNLESNIGRIAKIKQDGCYGVFLDEVSSQPKWDYLSAISDACINNGLKLIFNTGVAEFSSGLFTYANFIMTSEDYAGRNPTQSELVELDGVLVASQNVPTATEGVRLTRMAEMNEFKYHYPCGQYTKLPDWIREYAKLVETVPVPPTPSVVNITLPATFTLNIDRDGKITGSYRAG